MKSTNMLFPSAKIIIKHPRDSSQLLVVKRKGYYEPAGGKVEVNFDHKTGETLEACAIREAFEELGLEVKIDQYLGSYYFFWSIDPSKASVCAVFLGSITNYDNNVFASNRDKKELLIEPQWTTLDQIKKNINPEHIGLKEVFDLLTIYLAR